MNKEKTIWTESDYEDMNWHDCQIYAFSFDKKYNEFDKTTDLLFDIDYIAQWIKVPQKPNLSFKVAPCTLVFKGAWDLQMDIYAQLGCFEIASLLKVHKDTYDGKNYYYEWSIELQEGKICFKSFGFEQIMRQTPIEIEAQSLSMETRKGISFDKTPINEK